MIEHMPEPVIKYVGFQTAAIHMLNGGRAKFMDVNDDKIRKYIFTFDRGAFSFKYDEHDDRWELAPLLSKYLTNNGWILL